MSQTSCNVIRDLLVLYEDDVCSEDSRKLIEEHIATCEECRHIYEQTKKGIPEITLDNQDAIEKKEELLFAESAKKFARNITYRNLLLAGIVIFVLLLGDYFWTEHIKNYINTVPSEDVTVTELYRLESGDIYCTLKAAHPFNGIYSGGIKVPKEKQWKNYDKGWHELRFQYPMPLTPTDELVFYKDTATFIFPLEEKGISPWGEKEPYHYTCTSIKYTGKDKEDSLTIWKEGQDIPPAPAEMEEKVRKELEYRGQYYGEYINNYNEGSFPYQLTESEN